MTIQEIQTIDKIADIVRNELSINIPVTMENLCNAIGKLGGRCIADKSRLSEREYSKLILYPGNKNYVFEIIYDEEQSEKNKLFSIAHELGHLMLHVDMAELINKEKNIWKNTE